MTPDSDPNTPDNGSAARDRTFVITDLPQPPASYPQSTRLPGDPDDDPDEARAGLWDRLGDRWATAATAAAAGLVLLGVLVGMALLTDGITVTPAGAGQTAGEVTPATPPDRPAQPASPTAPETPPDTDTAVPSASPSASASATAVETAPGLPQGGASHDDDDDDDDDDLDDDDDDDDDDDLDDDDHH
ncbi:hypothetical protein Stsp02_57890 [Streptomyces sp. NBRC 14336]|uniref:hypothetical protein n=1 Tax=Streptomyces sp. NBRC 14336 TaxID=3030992 RepID=UPI0024A041B1|nr:hypothetical protein [Streptomyces sp. NBRC 14336]GLW50128.1 hypothetical protein Stsp02_57890 [Streptomyces sp. NBRC 14336]